MTLRLRVAVLSTVVVAALTACGDDDVAPQPEQHDGATTQVPPPMMSDAGDAATPEAGTPQPGFDASVFPLPQFMGQICALHVGASCDGDEDCSGGQRCCAHFDRLSYSYTSIQCSDTCEGLDSYALCHPGQECEQPGHVCRRSVIVPHDFITVCADPATVPGTSTSVSIDGQVVCGAGTCDAGDEVCCLRSNFDFTTQVLTALPPYCAPRGSACLCSDEAPIVDASTEDGG